ncbi:uncharacterized protein V6R79_015517 [Siganus canaliculatus]
MAGAGDLVVTPTLTPTLTLTFNQTLNGSGGAPTDCPQVDASTHRFFIAVYGLLFLVGLLLNGFSLKVYFCRAQQQASSSVTVYLKNLAAADFLLSLCLPIRISYYARSSAPLLQVYCNYGVAPFYLNMYASILFMGYIAANRYLKIVRPLGTHVLQTPRAARLVSTATWVFLLTVVGVYVALSVQTQDASKLSSAPSVLSCDVLHSAQLRLFYQLVHAASAAIFLAVLLALVFFYHSTSRRLALALQRQPASPGSRTLSRSRRNMQALVGVFFLCFVPYHGVRLPYALLLGPCPRSRLLLYLKELSLLLSALNVCLDPLLYFLFSRAFRAQTGARTGARTGISSAHIPTAGGGVDRRSADATSAIDRLNGRTSPGAASRDDHAVQLVPRGRDGGLMEDGGRDDA